MCGEDGYKQEVGAGGETNWAAAPAALRRSSSSSRARARGSSTRALTASCSTTVSDASLQCTFASHLLWRSSSYPVITICVMEPHDPKRDSTLSSRAIERSNEVALSIFWPLSSRRQSCFASPILYEMTGSRGKALFWPHRTPSAPKPWRQLPAAQLMPFDCAAAGADDRLSAPRGAQRRARGATQRSSSIQVCGPFVDITGNIAPMRMRKR